MIEVKNVVKRFEGFAALDGASLTAPKGGVCGLVGPNGSGKTTLIKHLAGVYLQDAGEVRIDGRPVWDDPAVKARIGYVPDDRYFFTQAGILEMARQYRSLYPSFSRERYKALRGEFQLDERQPLRKFSKGMQKQASFWLALSCMPDVLLLDEPVDGLDPVMRRRMWALLMDDVSERGLTVLVSSHNLRELEDVCDRVAIMDRGRIVLQHSLSELQAGTVKVQAVFPEGARLPTELKILHDSSLGRVRTLILRAGVEEAKNKLSCLQPLFLDVIPLSLEEIFIYELGGERYAKNVL